MNHFEMVMNHFQEVMFLLPFCGNDMSVPHYFKPLLVFEEVCTFFGVACTFSKSVCTSFKELCTFLSSACTFCHLKEILTRSLGHQKRRFYKKKRLLLFNFR